MIDTFTLLLSHGLLMLTAWKLVRRPDLDRDDAAEPAPAGFLQEGRPPHA